MKEVLDIFYAKNVSEYLMTVCEKEDKFRMELKEKILKIPVIKRKFDVGSVLEWLGDNIFSTFFDNGLGIYGKLLLLFIKISWSPFRIKNIKPSSILTWIKNLPIIPHFPLPNQHQFPSILINPNINIHYHL